MSLLLAASKFAENVIQQGVLMKSATLWIFWELVAYLCRPHMARVQQ